MLELKYKNIDWVYENRYEGNAKEHDIGAICESINKHGFRSPVLWDDTLNAVIAGNGRTEAVYQLWQIWVRQGGDVPNGINVVKKKWQIPVIYGVNSESIPQALAYLVDDNNLTMAGGDLTAVDMSRAWEMEGYLTILQQAVKETVSVDEDDYQLLLHLAQASEKPLEFDYEEEPEEEKEKVYRLTITFPNEDDRDHAQKLLRSGAINTESEQWEYLLSVLDY